MDHQAGLTISVKAASGIRWGGATEVLRQALQLVTTLIFARLLVVADFGLMGIAMVVVGFLLLFRDLGTASAIVRLPQEQVTERFLSSIFWINVGMGVVVASVLFFLAPVVSTFFAERRVEPILEVLAVTFVISSLGIVHQALLQKAMAFSSLARVEMFSAVFGAVAGIAAAYGGAGVWSFVIQAVVGACFSTISLWIATGWRPELAMNWNAFRTIQAYSLNLSGFNVLNYVIRNVDNFLIGWFLGAQSLGFYSLAYRIVFYPVQAISNLVSRVMFPAYSEFHHDEPRFRRVYLKVVGSVAIVCFPIMLGLMPISDLLVPVIFGSQWGPVALLLVIFAPIGLFQSIAATVGAIYQAKGRTDLLFKWGVFAATVMTVSFLLGVQNGLVGVAWAYAVASLLVAYHNFRIPFDLIGLRVMALYNVLWQPFACGVVMVLCMVLSRAVFPIESASLRLVVLVTAGGLIYGGSTLLINRQQFSETYRTLRMGTVGSIG